MKGPQQPSSSTTTAVILPRVPDDERRPVVMRASYMTLTAILCTMLVAATQFRDANDALAFYGVYHRHPVNQAIHFVGVPGIVWSIMIVMAHLPVSNRVVLQLPLLPRHYVSLSTLTFLFYVTFYFMIDVVGAALYLPFLYTMYATSVRWTAADQQAAKQLASNDQKRVPWTGTGRLIKWALVVHAVSWYIQIHPGHAVYEGAKPALLQSLGGSLTSAPLFAFYEGVWALGWRRDFQARVLALVDEYTAVLCDRGATMRVCASL